MKINFLSAAFMIILLTAGIDSAAQKPYAYGTSLDLQAGYAISPYSVFGESTRAYGVSGGLALDFRATHFWGRHLGGFAQIGLAETSTKDFRYFNTVNKADGGHFIYDPGTDFHGSTQAPLLLAGPVWRQDTDNCSFRFRLGFGIAGFPIYTEEYARYDRAGSTPTFVTSHIVPKQVDYLISEDVDPFEYSQGRFAISPSIQFAYSPVPHLHISAEIGASILPARVDVCTTTMEGKSIRDAQGWKEKVDYLFSYLSDYVTDTSTTQTRINTMSVGSLFYVSFGIGWDIGLNRYASGYYRR